MGSVTSNCPFMLGETAFCEMNVLNHIASWQTMFTSLPAKLSVFVLVLLVLAVSRVWLRHLFDPHNASEKQTRFSYSSDRHAPSFKSLFLDSVIRPRAP